MEKLPEGRIVAVAVGDSWHVTCGIWHVTYDTRHILCDMWHMTYDMWHMAYFLLIFLFRFLWYQCFYPLKDKCVLCVRFLQYWYVYRKLIFDRPCAALSLLFHSLIYLPWHFKRKFITYVSCVTRHISHVRVRQIIQYSNTIWIVRPNSSIWYLVFGFSQYQIVFGIGYSGFWHPE